MKKYKENVAQFADYHQIIQLNPFDAVVCLRKVDTKAFEVVNFNDKLPSFMKLQDVKATNAEQFFTEQCWLQLSNILQKELNIDQTLEACTEHKVKTFVVRVLHLENSAVAVILREKQKDEEPYLQFVEQGISGNRL